MPSVCDCESDGSGDGDGLGEAVVGFLAGGLGVDGVPEVAGESADATRRGVLTRLSEGLAPMSALPAPAGITLAGTAKHIRVLELVGLVATEKVGRERICRLGPQRLDDLAAWVAFCQHLWQRRFTALETYLSEQPPEEGEAP